MLVSHRPESNFLSFYSLAQKRCLFMVVPGITIDGTLMGHLLPTSGKTGQQVPTTESFPRLSRSGGLIVVACCRALPIVVYAIELKGLKIPWE